MTRVTAILATLLALAVPALADEQRCRDLGAACVCSEPFNTTSYVGGPDFWNPADSTTKQCSVEPASIGGAVVRTSATIQGSSDATALSRLPSGHGVRYILRANDNHEGTFSAGNGVPVSANMVRLAARWYVYHSPNFAFKDGISTCQNTKFASLDNSVIDYTAGFHTYNYLQFSPPLDCCVSGPGPNTGISPSRMQGKWWMLEVILTNRNSAGFRVEMFGRNVTDNQPEIKILETQGSKVGNVTPPRLQSQINTNNHRWSPSGNACAGWRGLSHYVMAGWTTNAGQRIGAASEVEGGGSTPPPPPPPPPSGPPSPPTGFRMGAVR